MFSAKKSDSKQLQVEFGRLQLQQHQLAQQMAIIQPHLFLGHPPFLGMPAIGAQGQYRDVTSHFHNI